MTCSDILTFWQQCIEFVSCIDFHLLVRQNCSANMFLAKCVNFDTICLIFFALIVNNISKYVLFKPMMFLTSPYNLFAYYTVLICSPQADSSEVGITQETSIAVHPDATSAHLVTSLFVHTLTFNIWYKVFRYPTHSKKRLLVRKINIYLKI